MWEKLQNIDRRWIYVLMAIVIAIPILKPMGLPIKLSDETKAVYNALDSLKAGDVLWIGGDYGPSSAPELSPMFVAMLNQAFRKNLKVIVYCMWQDGAQLTQAIAEPIANKYGKKYGADWINIGYKPEGAIVLRNMTDNIPKAAINDFNGKPLGDYALIQQVKKLDKDTVAFAFDLSTGSPGTADYLKYVREPKGIPMAVGVTAVSGPGEMPYVRSGQYKGMLNGMRGAAEYELMNKVPGPAVKGMDAQSLGHFLILILVILGNVGYLMTRKN